MPFIVSKNGQTFGPHTAEEIAAFIAQGAFDPGDYCWQEGWTDWRPLSSLNGDGQPQAAAPAEIPSDIEIIGTLKLPGEREVACRVDGEIHSPATVTIPPGASVKAHIRAESVIIGGEVTGDIHATGRVMLKSSCTLHGDIHAARVLVEEGATFKGKSHVKSAAAG